MTMSASAANACSMSAAATTLRPSVASFALVGSRKVQGQAKIASVQSNGGWSSAQLLKMLGHDTRADGLQLPRMQITASVGRTEESDVTKKTETYSDSMQQAMGSGLTYRHELGMNYAHVLPDLIVGSCPQTPSDVDRLKGAGVGTIFCLQQDPDLAYFSVDICAIQERAKELDGIEHIRAQIRDFDPYDLRLRLPKVVAELYKATKRNEGTAYVHCTAGLGRAPAVALTYMYWIRGYELFEANAMLQKVRSCHPKLDSIKAATADMLTGNAKEKVRLSWWRGAAESVEVAGLDVGWYERVAFTKGDDGHWHLDRELPVGRYEFKFIVDGNWCTNPDCPFTQPNKDGHINNFVEVAGDNEKWELRKRIMANDFVLTEEHRQIIKEKLEFLAED